MLLRLREILISLAAVLICHLAEKSCKSCIIVGCHFVINVILAVVLKCPGFGWTSHKSYLNKVAVFVRYCKVIFP